MRLITTVLLSLLLSAPAWAQPSPDCTTIPPATSITDSGGHVWTLSGLNVLVDGASAAGGLGSVISWFGGSIYVTSGPAFYRWAGAGYTSVTALPQCPSTTPTPTPLPTTTPVDDWACASGPSSVTLAAGPHDIGWTWSQKDSSGNAATGPFTWTLTLNGVSTIATPTTAPVCSTGDTPYHVTAFPIPAGMDNLVVSVSSPTASAPPTDPVAITATSLPLTKPHGPKVK